MLKNTLQDIKWVLWTILIIIRCMKTKVWRRSRPAGWLSSLDRIRSEWWVICDSAVLPHASTSRCSTPDWRGSIRHRCWTGRCDRRRPVASSC